MCCYNVEKLYEKLINIGYNSETLVTKTGDVGLRGFVIDVFPLGEDNPYRIEFFGDEIESIRLFDTDTQKSLKNVKDLVVYPFTEFLMDENENIDDETFGMLFIADINSFEELHSEIEKILISDKLVENWTYPLIQPILIEEAKKRGFI